MAAPCSPVHRKNLLVHRAWHVPQAPNADGRLFLFTLACAGSAVFLLPFLVAQRPEYEHVGQALRFCLSDLVIMKAVPARTSTRLGLDLGEQTLNAKGAGLHGCWSSRA